MGANSQVVIVSSWVVMATMPDIVVHSMESINPPPTAVIVCRAWGDRL